MVDELIETLVKRRIALKISQRSVAREIGVVPSVISDFENRVTVNPGIYTIYKYAKAVKLDWYITERHKDLNFLQIIMILEGEKS